MTESYRVKYVDRDLVDCLDVAEVFKNIKCLHITHYPWDTNDYRPEVEVRLFYTLEHLHIQFRSYETQIKAEYRLDQEPVCRDSCVEFFVNPDPENNSDYLNFEVNPVGTLRLAAGVGREGRRDINGVKPSLMMYHSVSAEKPQDYSHSQWTISYAIPFWLLKRHTGGFDAVSGHRMHANFYKCGDDTAKPHFGCWNYIHSDKPDFHRPECFGQLILE